MSEIIFGYWQGYTKNSSLSTFRCVHMSNQLCSPAYLALYKPVSKEGKDNEF